MYLVHLFFCYLAQLQNVMINNFDYIMFVANLLVFLLCILSDSHPEGYMPSIVFFLKNSVNPNSKATESVLQ